MQTSTSLRFRYSTISSHHRCCLCSITRTGDDLVEVTEVDAVLWSASSGVVLQPRSRVHRSHLATRPAGRAGLVKSFKNIGSGLQGPKADGPGGSRGPSGVVEPIAVTVASTEAETILMGHLERAESVLLRQYAALIAKEKELASIARSFADVIERDDTTCKQWTGVPTVKELKELHKEVMAKRVERRSAGHLMDAPFEPTLFPSRRIVVALMIWLHCGVTQRRVATLVAVPLATLNRYMHSFLPDLFAVARDYVRYLTPNELKQHTMPEFAALWPKVLCVADCTYLYVHHSDTHLLQAVELDVGQKGKGSKRHLDKYLVVVTSTGFIMDIVGPFGASADAFDWQILNKLFHDTTYESGQGFRNYVQQFGDDWQIMYDRGGRSRPEYEYAKRLFDLGLLNSGGIDAGGALSSSAPPTGGGASSAARKRATSASSSDGSMSPAEQPGASSDLGHPGDDVVMERAAKKAKKERTLEELKVVADDWFERVGQRLVMPQFSFGKQPFTELQAQLARRVTRFRNVVENGIRRLNEEKLVAGTLPLATSTLGIELYFIAAMKSNRYKKPLRSNSAH